MSFAVRNEQRGGEAMFWVGIRNEEEEREVKGSGSGGGEEGDVVV